MYLAASVQHPHIQATDPLATERLREADRARYLRSSSLDCRRSIDRPSLAIVGVFIDVVVFLVSTANPATVTR